MPDGDAALARTLTNYLSSMLCRAGLYAVRSSDMSYWVDLLEANGEWINRQFYPDLNADPREFLAIYDASGAFAGTIAWRKVTTESYGEMMRTALAWIGEPGRVGWQPFEPGAGDDIRGLVYCRGGLYVRDKGKRLSWALTGLHWAIALEEGADFVASHSKPAITDARLPERVYGYARVHVMPEHTYPWVHEPMAAALVWSDREAIRDEVASRVRFLRQRDCEDLRTASIAYERYQETKKGAQPVRAAALDEAEPRAPKDAGR